MRLIQKKIGSINKAKSSKRVKKINEKRLKEDMKSYDISIKSMNARKEIKKEMTSLIDHDVVLSEDTSIDSDLSYSEFNDLMKVDPTRKLFLKDIQNK